VVGIDINRLTVCAIDVVHIN